MKKKTLVFLLAMLLIAALAFTGCAKDAANDGINDGVKDEQGLVGELEDDLDGDRAHDEKNDDKTGQDADKQNDKKQSGSIQYNGEYSNQNERSEHIFFQPFHIFLTVTDREKRTASHAKTKQNGR